jgi:hypothetical protein
MTSSSDTQGSTEPTSEARGDALDVVSLPWLFTQHHPLDASSFIALAKGRGFDLDELKLRQLYKHGILIPFIGISSKRQVEPQTQVYDEPRREVTRLRDFREARKNGRLLDLNAKPFLPRLPFTSPRPHVSGWWSGLLYSHHQLSILPKLDDWLAHCRYSYRNGQLYPRFPEPDQFLKHWAAWYHRIALMATALEARYLPVLDPEWVHLVNADPDEYDRYRQNFDPVSMSGTLKYSAEQVRKDAEELLLLAHAIEPFGGPWSQLLRRAPRNSWKHLKGPALSAMNLRETAEILLRFYEDLVEHGAAEALPIIPRHAWHPLQERLSTRRQTLDEDLMSLGISPHPRVILAVEGESEEKHVPRVWKKLGYPENPELVRFMKLGGVDKDPVKLAALATTPLVTRKDPHGEFWWVTKPPTRFMVAVDPEGRYAPGKIAETKKAIINEIRTGLAVQGAKIAESELNELVELRTWDAKCYEYAHFTDEELAVGISAVHDMRNFWSNEKLLGALAHWREQRQDIERVWRSGYWDAQLNRPSGKWNHEVSKPKLAEALWPILEQKIEAAMTEQDAPMPAIAQVIQDAFVVAQNWRYKSFVFAVAEQY